MDDTSSVMVNLLSVSGFTEIIYHIPQKVNFFFDFHSFRQLLGSILCEPPLSISVGTADILAGHRVKGPLFSPDPVEVWEDFPKGKIFRLWQPEPDFSASGGLTFSKKYAKLSEDTGCEEDMRPGKIPREGAALVQGIRTPAADDTTSEPHARKCHAGCARYRVNEWRFCSRNQGGTVEYICIPPLIFQGVGIFIPFPNPKGGKNHV